MSDVMTDDRLITHLEQPKALHEAVNALRDKIITRGDLSYTSVSEQLALLEELQTFPLGQFILLNKGLNGYWIDYIVHYPFRGKFTGLGIEHKPLCALELKMLEHFPVFVATQERFQHFLDHSQALIKNGAKCASLPCGVMSELLDLDFKDVDSLSLVGIDLDAEILKKAEKSAEKLGLSRWVRVEQSDAWAWHSCAEYDLVISNGLNIYEPDDRRVEAFYQRLGRALKEKGTLITSILTSPPGINKACGWEMNEIRTDMLRLQRIIFSDIVGVSWQCYRTEAQTRHQLMGAGFSKVNFIYDRAKIMPTVIATK